jgi:ABC-type bacteriocin/lantibiotic exporter with double-glycine peptidase domain
LSYKRILNLIQATTSTIDTIMATLMTFLNVVFYIKLTDLALVPSIIVYAIGFYMRLCYSIGFMFSSAFTKFINAIVSIGRMNEFLLAEEIKDTRQAPRDPKTAIEMENFNFRWKNDDSFGIEKVSLKVKKGNFAAIVGPVGSGKVKLSNFGFKICPIRNTLILIYYRVHFCLACLVN